MRPAAGRRKGQTWAAWLRPPTAMSDARTGSFTVEAADGAIGHVDRQQDQPGRQHLVVDTGAWVFGQSVLIPAGAVTVIDTEAQTGGEAL